MIKPNLYHSSLLKRLFDLGCSFFGLVIFSPLFLVIAIVIKLTSKGPVFFIQKRVGKGGKVFKFIKFRTMKEDAARKQWRYKHLNEADGPVFKIQADPRFTKFGKILSGTGLDELPQLAHVLKGEMSLVGPRPLPLSEVKKLTPVQKKRHLIKPGLTSLWVVNGAHCLSFRQWMLLDRNYVQKASIPIDARVLLGTAKIILRQIFL